MNKSRFFCIVIVAFLAYLSSAIADTAGVAVSIKLNQHHYYPEDNMELAVTVNVPEETLITADVYLSLEIPDGTIFYLGPDADFGEPGVAVPVVTEWQVVNLPETVLQFKDLPKELPHGDYKWKFLLATHKEILEINTGNMTPVSEISFIEENRIQGNVIASSVAEFSFYEDNVDMTCLPFEKEEDGQCVPCGNGYQDPTDPGKCVECINGAMLMFRQTGMGYQGEVDYYESGYTPFCKCPEQSAGREDENGNFAGCEEFCPAMDELWSQDYGRCVKKADLAPGGECIDSDGDGLDNCFENTQFHSDPDKTDSDNDGLDDFREWYNGCNPNVADTDGDTIGDLEEILHNSSCSSADGDGDGLTDMEELDNGCSPSRPDTDDDGLTDYEEVKIFHTNPLTKDSDEDGLTDGEEVNGPEEIVLINPEVTTGSEDITLADPISGLGNPVLELPVFYSDPNKQDTDDDGLWDYFEVKSYGTDPKKKDTDDDCIDDATEIRYGLNAVDSSESDYDGDGLSDYDELFYASRGPCIVKVNLKHYKDNAHINIVNNFKKISDPTNADTDYDGVNDYLEWYGWDVQNSKIVSGNIISDPNSSDSDNDGLDDLSEALTYRTNVLLQDTDGDGLSDGREVNFHKTDPLKKDTDGDTINDGDEIAKGTDPLKADTDNDGMADNIDPDPFHSPYDSDTDNDGLSDLQEQLRGSDPTVADTDKDGLKDGEEAYRWKTSPTSADTDLDGLDDKFEIDLGLNPLTDDTDGDGYSDLDEYKLDGVTRASKKDVKYDKKVAHWSKFKELNKGQYAGRMFDKYIIGKAFPNGLNSVTYQNIQQGYLGNCFLMSPLKSIAAIHPEYIFNMIQDNHNGTYTVKLYENTLLKPVEVTVDASFPAAMVTGKSPALDFIGILHYENVNVLVNGKTEVVKTPVLWPFIITKAIAVLNGWQYSAVSGGMFWDGLDPLLGKPTEWNWAAPEFLRADIFKNQLEESIKYKMPLVFSNSGVVWEKSETISTMLASFFLLGFPIDPHGYQTVCPTYKDVNGMHVWAFMGKTSKASDGSTLYHIQNPWNATEVEQLDMKTLLQCFLSSGLGLRMLDKPYNDQ